MKRKQKEEEINPFLYWGVLLFFFSIFAFHTVTHALSLHNHAGHTVAAATCRPPAHTFQVTLTNHGVNPGVVNAKRCDKLIITNQTSHVAEPAFGPHEHHIHYPGFEEESLNSGESRSITLSETGNFPLHDHNDEGLRAEINVEE